ncbi:hypothetical protein CU633_02355 [Bacillus sp. V3-13]|uniref:hypothetical protein n=1 Tax=Bacillus sp. V3-13 TaxID=2053728 RepID=UPI000C77131D|nr:hypothetical protein [Bacillus sp. V3-13]PLR79047.1 hypothetical protein CU633_02355 [Bacillus sp. V3-13]
MDHIITMTTEELTILLSSADFSDEARELIHNSIKPKGASELEAIFKTTVNQLRMKGIWDELQHQLGLNPINEDTMSFLEIYANSKYMVRATNGKKKAALIFHYVEDDTWLYHFVDDEIIHEFAFMKESEIPGSLADFYSFSFPEGNKERLSFNLTDKSFDLLSNPQKQKKVEKSFKGNQNEKESFEFFLDDLTAHNHQMENISVFSIGESRQLSLENLVFFFQAGKGVWLTEYEKEKEQPVNIQLADKEKWQEILEGVQTFSSQLIKAYNSVANSK